MQERNTRMLWRVLHSSYPDIYFSINVFQYFSYFMIISLFQVQLGLNSWLFLFSRVHLKFNVQTNYHKEKCSSKCRNSSNLYFRKHLYSFFWENLIFDRNIDFSDNLLYNYINSRCTDLLYKGIKTKNNEYSYKSISWSLTHYFS